MSKLTAVLIGTAITIALFFIFTFLGVLGTIVTSCVALCYAPPKDTDVCEDCHDCDCHTDEPIRFRTAGSRRSSYAAPTQHSTPPTTAVVEEEHSENNFAGVMTALVVNEILHEDSYQEPVYETPIESTFETQGGDFGGAGASGTWEPEPEPVKYEAPSYDSTSYDSGSSSSSFDSTSYDSGSSSSSFYQ
jgi:hypothetical protein